MSEVHWCDGRLTIHGVSADGELCEAVVDGGLVGQQLEGGWRVRAVRRKDGLLLASRIDGYKVYNKYITQEEATRMLLRPRPKL